MKRTRKRENYETGSDKKGKYVNEYDKGKMKEN
jgi:hypothetical protein